MATCLSVASLGNIKVNVPKVRDRSGQGVKFNGALIPPYLKRTKAVEEFISCLYRKGISTGVSYPNEIGR